MILTYEFEELSSQPHCLCMVQWTGWLFLSKNDPLLQTRIAFQAVISLSDLQKLQRKYKETLFWKKGTIHPNVGEYLYLKFYCKIWDGFSSHSHLFLFTFLNYEK
jgi:hypothetical protein